MQKRELVKNKVLKCKTVNPNIVNNEISDQSSVTVIKEDHSQKQNRNEVFFSSKNVHLPVSKNVIFKKKANKRALSSRKQFRAKNSSLILRSNIRRANKSTPPTCKAKLFQTSYCNIRVKNSTFNTAISLYLSQIKISMSNDVEKNPGPNQLISCINKHNLTICSYNVNGIKNFAKMKRVTSFLNKLPFKNNCVINLQETHFNENEIGRLSCQWHGGLVTSCSNRSNAGVAILFNSNYFDSIINTFKDDHGRLCSVTASRESDTICFINLYAPNDHVEMIRFLADLENHIINVSTQNPEVKFILSGDFNLVLNPDVDCIGRKQSRLELNAVNYLKEIMIRHNLVDSYRMLNEWGGFTWGRDNPSYIRSRLDMILISKYFEGNLQESTHTRLPNESDHHFLYSALNLNKIEHGQGILRCNSALLDNPECKAIIVDKITGVIRDIPDEWNPHLKLDFIKTKLRQFMLEEGKKSQKKISLHCFIQILKSVDLRSRETYC
jgi:exonuclease III